VCRILTTADECGKVVGEVPRSQGSEISRRDHPWKRASQTRLRRTCTRNLAQAIYTIEAVNDLGRSAGSEIASMFPSCQLPLRRTLSLVDVRTDGVHIGIPPQAYAERTRPKASILVSSHATIFHPAAAHRILLVKYGSRQANLIDKNFEWEKQYAYTVTPITGWRPSPMESGCTAFPR